MKKNILLIMLFVSMMIQSQNQNNRPNIKEMHARKWEYIVDKANLSPQEAEKAQPIFMEYEQAVWKLMEKNRPFFMDGKKKDENSKPDFKTMNDKFINTEIQKAHLLKSYYQKLEKVISDESIFKIGGADRSFRKELVKDWQGKRKPKNQ